MPVVPRGKLSMPIFRALVPAGAPQVHLGTDLGGPDARVNVAIYNAGTEAAAATIEVRQTCDGAVTDSGVIAVPANSILQVGGLGTNAVAECPAAAAQPWARYTVVTVTQPSISLVSNLNENIVPNPAEIGTVPTVGLAVAKNETF